MSVSVREVLQGIAVGAGLELTTGAATRADDVLVVTHSTHFYTLADMDPPTPGSWTLATFADDGEDRVKTKVWVRVAGSAGAQTITLPPVLDTHTFGRLRVLAGADTATVVDDAAGDNGFGPTQPAPSVSPATGDAFLCCDWIADSEITYSAPPAGMTASGSQLQDFSTAYGAHEQLAAAGATGTRTPTTSASASWAATTVAIRTAAQTPQEDPLALATRSILNQLASHAAGLGYFERVNQHEPVSPPGHGLTAAVWPDRIRPVPRRSGLAVTSALVVFNLRIFTSPTQEPRDEIDPQVVDATDALINAYTGDFTLAGEVSHIDLLGAHWADGLSARAGYIPIGTARQRVVTITVPVVIDDVWTQAA